MSTTSTAADAFEAALPRLVGLAYRLLGSRAEAEDVVGDVAERWLRADRAAILEPEGWLVTVTTRRALDVLRSARLQRVDYPGEWLPEPIATAGDPTIDVERLETLTMGFLLLLERLTPIERAVFVLHDVLDHPYDLVAAAVGRSQDACRQAARRARRHVAVPAGRSAAERRHAAEVAGRFLAVDRGQELADRLLELLAPEVVVTSDGGGIVHAAMRPVTGQQRAARYLATLSGRIGDDPLVVPCELNGEPGVLLHDTTGWVAIVTEVDGDRLTHVRLVVSPPKLERLVASLGEAAAGRPGPWDGTGRFRHRAGRPVTSAGTTPR